MSGLKVLGGLDAKDFIEQYWQRKALFINQGLDQDQCDLVSPEELAGLACEEEVEARIVIHDRKKNKWRLKHGPFSEDDFDLPPATLWSLLVQDVDKFLPVVSDILDNFKFIPNWRIDDIMISLSSAGGSVGPHVDSYHVFLIQARGVKRWQIDQKKLVPQNSRLLKNSELAVLAAFESSEEWLLNPGDILYLPPGVPHFGVAMESNCITYSVGFRAPSLKNMMAHYIDCKLNELEGDPLCEVPLSLSQHAGLIDEATLDQIAAFLTRIPMDKINIANWFGSYITEPKFELEIETSNFSQQDFCKLLKTKSWFRRDENCRVSFVFDSDGIFFFANGKKFACPKSNLELIRTLTQQNAVPCKELQRYLDDPHVISFLLQLTNLSYYYFV